MMPSVYTITTGSPSSQRGTLVVSLGYLCHKRTIQEITRLCLELYYGFKFSLGCFKRGILFRMAISFRAAMVLGRFGPEGEIEQTVSSKWCLLYQHAFSLSFEFREVKQFFLVFLPQCLYSARTVDPEDGDNFGHLVLQLGFISHQLHTPWQWAFFFSWKNKVVLNLKLISNNDRLYVDGQRSGEGQGEGNPGVMGAGSLRETGYPRGWEPEEIGNKCRMVAQFFCFFQ